MQDFWVAVSALAPATWIRGSGTAYLVVNALHILSLGYLLGNIITLDLRVLGLHRMAPLSALGPVLSRGAATGLGMAILTGAWLFSVDPFAYVDNPGFVIKLCLVVSGIINAVWLHHRGRWQAAVASGRPDLSVRLHACASLTLWIGAVLAGRWIGFI